LTKIWRLMITLTSNDVLVKLNVLRLSVAPELFFEQVCHGDFRLQLYIYGGKYV
jgi:hypothetical protein